MHDSNSLYKLVFKDSEKNQLPAILHKHSDTACKSYLCYKPGHKFYVCHALFLVRNVLNGFLTFFKAEIF